MGGVRGQKRRLLHTRAAVRVESVPDAVLAGGDRETDVAEVVDAREAASLGVGVVAALQQEVGRRVRDELQAGFDCEIHDTRSVGIVVRRERARVTGGHVLEPAGDGLGSKILQRTGARVVGFVDVRVNGGVELRGKV
jgi:hypothetical protein